MQPKDSQRFLTALYTMADYFSDELSELRQRTYWDLTHEACSIDEWEYACKRAMQQATFHKVPLIAELMVFVEERREAQREARWMALQKAQHATQAALPPPTPLTADEAIVLLRQIQTTLGEAITYPKAPAAEQRSHEYRKPLALGDYTDRKARLRAQAQQIEEQSHGA